jgi:hypothetical protein
MPMTKAPHHKGEIVTIQTDEPGPFTACDGLMVRITDLYWEEDAWGYAVEPAPDTEANAAQRRVLMMVTLHDRDFAGGAPTP